MVVAGEPAAGGGGTVIQKQKLVEKKLMAVGVGQSKDWGARRSSLFTA